jgi:hypothetical protein
MSIYIYVVIFVSYPVVAQCSSLFILHPILEICIGLAIRQDIGGARFDEIFLFTLKFKNYKKLSFKYIYSEIEKKIKVGCDQKFHLAIRLDFNYQILVLKVRLVI